MSSILQKRFLILAGILGATFAQAEHRVALLIGTDSPNLEQVSAGLEKSGFRCTLADMEGGTKLRDVVGSFALRTPTRGVAFVYFQGEAEVAEKDGKSSLNVSVPHSRDRYSLSDLLEALISKGGSKTNLVFIDSTSPADLEIEMPEDCLVTIGKTDTLLSGLDGRRDLVSLLAASGPTQSTLPPKTVVEGQGTKAIAPPTQFVQGKRPGDEWVNRLGIVFCWCPPGTYIAGSPENEPGRYPDETQREVKIENGFWMSKYELVLTQNLRSFGKQPRDALGSRKLHPLTMVNYDDATGMTQRRFSEEERKAGRLPEEWEYSLCTDEQWEYAARAGSQTAYSFGDDPTLLIRHGNFADKSFFDTKDIYSLYGHRELDDGAPQLAEVGSYLPNAWGFYDMHGNVAEWCLGYAVRGGSWVNTLQDCRIAFRHNYSSRNEQNFIGYRIVIRKVPPEEKSDPKKR